MESAAVRARALIVTRLVTPRAGPGRSLEELLLEAGIPALEGVDTRALTLELRGGAARRAVIRPVDEAGQQGSDPPLVGQAAPHPARGAGGHRGGGLARGAGGVAPPAQAGGP